MSSTSASSTHQPACMLSNRVRLGCRASTLARLNARHATHNCGCPLRQRRAACDTGRCKILTVQRGTPLRLQCLGGSQPVGAGVVSESDIETIDAVDVEALHLPTSDSIAGSLRLKNHEIERLSLDLKSQMLGLEVLTVRLCCPILCLVTLHKLTEAQEWCCRWKTKKNLLKRNQIGALKRGRQKQISVLQPASVTLTQTRLTGLLVMLKPPPHPPTPTQASLANIRGRAHGAASPAPAQQQHQAASAKSKQLLRQQ